MSDKNNENGSMSPILYWGALGAIFFVSNLISETDRDLAVKFFGITIVVWFFAPVLATIPGKDWNETKENISTWVYIIGVLIAGLIVLLIIGAILPSSCVPDDGGFIRPPRSL